MAYLKGYKYDIFISYSHLDNLAIFDEPQGWIENFFTNLTVSLWQSIGTRDIAIWWDNKKLDGDILFDDSIDEAIRNSAILLCLNSPAYLRSEYCKKELDAFYKQAQQNSGIRVEDRSRIINVLLYNISHDKWPIEFAGTTGFPFYDSPEKEERGHPFDINSSQFKGKLQSLSDSLVKLIDLIEQKKKPPAPAFTVYFGDVSERLRSIRGRIITELKKQDVKLIYDIPPPFEKAEHENTVREKLKEANLAVHLLDESPGTNIEGEETLWYPQKQAELSLQSGKPQLIWVPAETNIELIEEENYKAFLQSLENGKTFTKSIKYIRGTKSELAQQITDMINSIESKRPAIQGEKISVLLDTNYVDQLYALELSKGLLENEIQPFINPQEDDPRKNINVLEDRINQVSKLIFFYGKASRDWVKERMNAALQLIVSKNYPKKDFFIFMLPPHKEVDDLSLDQKLIKVNVINNSDTLQLDFKSLTPFFNSIKANS